MVRMHRHRVSCSPVILSHPTSAPWFKFVYTEAEANVQLLLASSPV